MLTCIFCWNCCNTEHHDLTFNFSKQLNNIEIINGLIDSVRKKGASHADAISFTSSSINASTRLGKFENIERAESNGVGLRVIIGKKQAIVSATDISQASLNELANRAINMAQLAPEDKYTDLASHNLLCKTQQDLDLFDEYEPTPDELLALAGAAENSALAITGITNSEGGEASYSSNIVAIATSNGFVGEYKTSVSSIAVSVLAGSGTKMERDYDFSSARHKSDLKSPTEIGRNAANKAVKKINPRRVKTCIAPIIFDPHVAKSIVSSFSSAVNGANIAKGASFLKDSFNKEIFAKNINILNNPHIKRGLASKPYDAEGVVNSNMYLIKDGSLQNWLLDIRSGNQLGLKTNGCATRGLSSPPSPSCSNLYMENGNISALDLISSVKSGFYVTETFGMGINIITGDYSQGASGFWIENGEIAYPVSELTIAGSLPEMFLASTPANDLEFRYSINCPTLLIEKMTIAGE